MITTKRIKILTIIFHGLIAVGAGHGGGPLFLFEAAALSNFQPADLNFSFSENDRHFFAAAATALLGQIAVIASFGGSHPKKKNLLHIAGLLLLWLSILYLGFDACTQTSVEIAWLSAAPFVACTVFTFAGRYLTGMYRRLISKL